MISSAKQLAGITNDQNLMVCLRIRPMHENEIHMGIPMIAHSLDGNVVVLLDPLEDPDDILRANRSREKQFVFDNVFNSSSTQEEVFNMSTMPLITQVLDGFTATVFAYGATGTGKTHTMLGNYEQPGIMIQALQALFSKMEVLEENLHFQVSISYLEVYNESIRDLLSPNSPILDLREDQYGGVQVAGLAEIDVTTTDEVMDILSEGNSRRTVEATAANKHSSRSHAVLQVGVTSRARVRTATQEHFCKGRLFLIDLAGSERASNTLNRGKRMTEGAHINRSLLALGNCINALADPNTKRYVNYRDSKLTRLLKDALGGNCRTVMIAHISPTSPHFEESRNTLVYADRAKHIRTKIHRNMYDINFHLVQYNSIIAELKLEINRLRNKLELMQSSGDNEENSVSVSMTDQVEEMKLKDQLLIAFQKQASCKKNLSDNLTNDMDLSLEETRCQVIIKEWELKKARRIPDRENKVQDQEMQLEEKSLELAGLELVAQPDNILGARNELKLAQMERQKLLVQRQKCEQDLDVLTSNIRQLEKTIPDRVRNIRVRQTLELLCRLHKLEMQQNDLRTDNSILRQHSTRHELIQAALLRHCDLCTQIISAQSQLIRNNSESIGELPKSLQMMLDLYDKDEPAVIINLSKDLVDTEKISYNFNKIDQAQSGQVDSSSDIRDITSNLSMHEVSHEEKQSTGSFPAIQNHRNTPDTWDNESVITSKPYTTRMLDDKPYTNVDKRIINNDSGYIGVINNTYKQPTSSVTIYDKKSTYQHQTNSKLMKTSLLPGIRGRQLIDSQPNASNKSDLRTKSIEPTVVNLSKNTINSKRRKFGGGRLDPMENILFDIDIRGPYQKSRSNIIGQNREMKTRQLGGYYKSSGQRGQQNRIPRRTENNSFREEKFITHRQHRAREIKKLNERKPDEILEDYEDSEENIETIL